MGTVKKGSFTYDEATKEGKQIYTIREALFFDSDEDTFDSVKSITKQLNHIPDEQILIPLSVLKNLL